MKKITVTIHSVERDGLPDMEKLVGRVAFIFDGCVVSGWPYGGSADLWEANSDVGHGGSFGGVTHWIEFPASLSDLQNPTPETP